MDLEVDMIVIVSAPETNRKNMSPKTEAGIAFATTQAADLIAYARQTDRDYEIHLHDRTININVPTQNFLFCPALYEKAHSTSYPNTDALFQWKNQTES